MADNRQHEENESAIHGERSKRGAGELMGVKALFVQAKHGPITANHPFSTNITNVASLPTYSCPKLG
jgi:hypothetical protein